MTKAFVFWLFEEDNVVFETCGSNFDTKLYLYNASDTKVHGQSINNCHFGDACYWTTVHNVYCDHDTYPKAETIPMMNLPAGLYSLDLFPWSANVYGEYNLSIHCGVEMPEPFNGTLDQCNYVQLGTLQGDLKELSYPFNESVQDGAVYPIGYCYHIKGIPYSFQFECGGSGVWLRTFEQSKTCQDNVVYGEDRSYIVRGEHWNTSGLFSISET